MNKKTPEALWHALAWIIYTFLLYIVNHLTKPNITILGALFIQLPFCSTFYISIFFLQLNKTKNILWGIFSFFIVFIFMGGISFLYIYHVLPFWGIIMYTSKSINQFLQSATLGYIQYFAYAMLYFYLKEALRKERELRLLQEEKSKIEQQKIQKELENAILKQQELNAQKEKLQFEYAFLQAQINPHFLHNTLNVLFSQALKYSPVLADNILKLSRIMRYSLESLEFKSGRVSLQKELEHLQTLLDIYNLRFGNSKNIVFSMEGELSGQILPPLSIITIVENAFKYGDLKDPNHPMQIKVVLQPKEIYFYCFNKKRKSNIQLSSLNIGITNLSKRLDAYFKDMYTINTQNDEEFYTFELVVKN